MAHFPLHEVPHHEHHAGEDRQRIEDDLGGWAGNPAEPGREVDLGNLRPAERPVEEWDQRHIDESPGAALEKPDRQGGQGHSRKRIGKLAGVTVGQRRYEFIPGAVHPRLPLSALLRL